MHHFCLGSIALAHVLLLPVASAAAKDEWGVYGHDLGGTRYSPLTQITPENVDRLKQVWEFHTGDFTRRSDGSVRSGFEATPLLVGGRLVLTSAFNRIIALEPATGRQLWAYDPKIKKAAPYGDGLINRGLAAWEDPTASGRTCGARLFEATVDARLVAVDAKTGTPCTEFGVQGQVDLTEGVANYQPGLYHMTSPPIVLLRLA